MSTLALAAVATLPASGDRSTASPAPSYLSGLGDRFELPSNARLTNARELLRSGENGNLNKPPGKGEPYAQIWAKSCPHDGQTVSFRRTIDIPGPASEAEFQIQPAITGSIPSKVLRSYKLLVNGNTAAKGGVFRTHSNRLTKFDAADLAGLRNGPNLIEVRLRRGELPEGMRRCNTKPRKNGLGVFFLLTGKFAADMALFTDKPPDQYYKAQSPVRNVFLNLSVRNDGPSAILEDANFVVTVAGGSGAALIQKPNPPFASCTPEGGVRGPFIQFTCLLTRMPPGEKGFLTVGFQREFTSTDFTEQEVLVTWRVHSSTPDPDISDNTRQVKVIFCGTKSTKPECASAQ